MARDGATIERLNLDDVRVKLEEEKSSFCHERHVHRSRSWNRATFAKKKIKYAVCSFARSIRFSIADIVARELPRSLAGFFSSPGNILHPRGVPTGFRACMTIHHSSRRIPMPLARSHPSPYVLHRVLASLVARLFRNLWINSAVIRSIRVRPRPRPTSSLSIVRDFLFFSRIIETRV